MTGPVSRLGVGLAEIPGEPEDRALRDPYSQFYYALEYVWRR